MPDDSIIQQFACGYDHTVMAWNKDGSPADLTQCFCPLCLGAAIGENDTLDLRFLAPKQTETRKPPVGCDSSGHINPVTAKMEWTVGPAKAAEISRLKADLQHQAVLTGGPMHSLDEALKQIDELKRILQEYRQAIQPFAEVGKLANRALLQALAVGGASFMLPNGWVQWCMDLARLEDKHQ